MAKLSSSATFKNCFFRIVEDEINGKEEVWIVEQLKDEDVYTNLSEVLEMFSGIEGLSISIKYEKGFNQD